MVGGTSNAKGKETYQDPFTEVGFWDLGRGFERWRGERVVFVWEREDGKRLRANGL